MKQNTGYIVLAVAGSIYILFNFIITSFIVGEEYSLGNIFLAELIVFIPLGVFFVVIKKLHRKKRLLFTSVSFQSVSVHILLLISLIAIHSVWQVYFNSVFIGTNFTFYTVRADIIWFLNLRVLIYIISIGLVAGIIKIQEKENHLVEQSGLRLQLQKASFKELELKLNPEVIYPNLAFIKHNVHDKPDETSELVLNLSKQLRILIDNIDEERIPLKKDILFFEYYFQAVHLRLDRPLTTCVDVTDDCLNVEIPSLVLLIPFLEDLFFNKYATFTQPVKKVIYQSGRDETGFTQLVLEMYYVNDPKILLREILTDPKFNEINALVAAYDGSSLKAKVVENCLSIILTMPL